MKVPKNKLNTNEHLGYLDLVEVYTVGQLVTIHFNNNISKEEWLIFAEHFSVMGVLCCMCTCVYKHMHVCMCAFICMYNVSLCIV